MNVARALHSRYLPPRPLLPRPALSRYLLPGPRPSTARSLANSPPPPINGTMQQQIDKDQFNARFFSTTMVGIYAFGDGLVIWFIQDSIKEGRKSKDA
ncbi:hypothetical protein TWF730_006172 [Orbilia blumenaviensis]|uniref:Uncharacterized protein n=1 Tax=Orbilia blumenaviensis TaxID=1796055 RepID=A0AAV9TVX6_9PEZI